MECQLITEHHTHTHFHILGQFRVTNPPTCIFLWGRRKPENLQETRMNMEKCVKLHTFSNPSSGSNCKLWSHPKAYYFTETERVEVLTVDVTLFKPLMYFNKCSFLELLLHSSSSVHPILHKKANMECGWILQQNMKAKVEDSYCIEWYLVGTTDATLKEKKKNNSVRSVSYPALTFSVTCTTAALLFARHIALMHDCHKITECQEFEQKSQV